MSNFKDELPKGMSFTDPVPEVEEPASFNLGSSNYIAAIYQALEMLPIEICVDRCLVLEKRGESPEVRLTLRILREKGEVG